jgi:hypothetical protein
MNSVLSGVELGQKAPVTVSRRHRPVVPIEPGTSDPAQNTTLSVRRTSYEVLTSEARHEVLGTSYESAGTWIEHFALRSDALIARCFEYFARRA